MGRLPPSPGAGGGNPAALRDLPPTRGGPLRSEDGGRMRAPRIRADTLLFTLRAELDELTCWLGVFKEDSAYSAEDVANAEGKVEVLEWAIGNVTARAKKAAA